MTNDTPEETDMTPGNAVTMPNPSAIQFVPVDPMVSLIERLMTDPNVDLNKLERMLDLRERMQKQEEERAFDRALSAAKAEIGPIRKNHQVSFTNDRGKTTEYRHETLAEVERTITPILGKHGLHYRYHVNQDMQNGGLISVTCIVVHDDGHRETTTLQASRDDGAGRNNFQAVGSAITYLKRYSLMAILGLSSETDEDDDDGRGAAPEPVISAEQFHDLRLLLDQDGNVQAFLKHYGIDTVPDLPAARYEEAVRAIRNRLAKRAQAQRPA